MRYKPNVNVSRGRRVKGTGNCVSVPRPLDTQFPRHLDTPKEGNEDFMEQTVNKTVNLLHAGEYTIVVQKQERQYTSKKHGIAPILDLLNENAKMLQDAIVADKVIGKAAALLLIYGKVKYIHADIISELAIEVLNEYKVSYTFDQKVPYIINRTKTDMCPMERCVLEINDPEHAFVALIEAIEKLKNNLSS